MKQFIFIISIFTVVTASAQKQFDQSKTIDSFIMEIRNKYPEIPSIAVSVVNKNQSLFKKVYGYANIERQIKADENTLYYIASTGKSFMAMAALLEDRDNGLKLDVPANQYLKNVGSTLNLPEKVTLRSLLTHTSGLQNDALSFRMAYTADLNNKVIKKLLAEETTYTDSLFGIYNYSNTGYNIYSELMKEVFSKTWQDVIQKRIFNPLGMNSTYTSRTKIDEQKKAIALPYLPFSPSGNIVRSYLEKTDGNMHAAGGIYTTLGDMEKWVMANINSGKLNNKQVFPQSIVTEAHTGVIDFIRREPFFFGKSSYGMGWMIGQYADEKVIYHHGGFIGHSSHCSFIPTKDLGIIIFTNLEGLGLPIGEVIATYIYDLSLVGVKQANQKADERLSQIQNMYAAVRKRAASAKQERQFELSHPYTVYSGQYTNNAWGTIEITTIDNQLHFKWGVLTCVAEPAPTGINEAVRLEFRPGHGEIVRFNIEGNKCLSIELNERKYFRK